MAHPSHLLNLDGSANILALLGPTNTGKTHQAIERMLRYHTGTIGLPLRLLAREVYDRVSTRVGEQAVALVTGEEKRVPPNPRYWVCTVESMPLDRPVAFLAVDEIQLCAHRERGHTFTDRLLHARGVNETLFLGAASMAPLLSRLVPTARVQQSPRFSRLEYAGPRKLVALPPRSAVVAFTAADVYELAERLRRRHGGTAVVLGALSPRTRNAQVAMYQAGEVQHLVATDAIGMGLNLDVDFMAFSALRKFDGHEFRALTAAEVGQIAGRAGRYRHDGRFGPLSSLGPMDPDLVQAVEQHRFPTIQRIYYRNARLDFSSLEALARSLRQPPPHPALQPVPRADDNDALEALLEIDGVRALCTSPAAVACLWDVCQIPNYHRGLSFNHAYLVASIFRQLCQPPAHLTEDWLARRVERLDRPVDDIEGLMLRIAQVRTWTYVAYRPGWVARPAHWQARTRAIEDRLSDALHEALTRRFVDRRAVLMLGSGTVDDGDLVMDEGGAVSARGVALGHLRGLRFIPAAGLELGGIKQTRRAILRLLSPLVARRVHALDRAPHAEFRLDDEATLWWDDAPVGRWVAGPDILSPNVSVHRHDLLTAGARRQIERRLRAWTRDVLQGLLEPLHRQEARQLSAAGRGLVYQLQQGLGTIPCHEVRPQLRLLNRQDRRLLAQLDVRLGHHFVYVGSWLEPERVALKAALFVIFHSSPPLPLPTSPDTAWLPLAPQVAPVACQRLGFPLVGGCALRVDLLETLAARARGAAHRVRGRG